MLPGQTVSHYEIVKQLGQGGMGIVYLARDVTLDRTVALKSLPPDMSLDEEAKERFIREAKAASALDHANICTIHEIAETDKGELYIVMAFYEGKTLEERLTTEDFSVERAADIALQLARALERAHEAGIVHRDLKPANVMITDRGEVKLLDFGIAKLTSGRTLTQTGAIMGSPGYLSPEQIDGQGVDHRTDLWSLGVILYQLLTKERPFAGDVEPAVMYAIINKQPAPLSHYRNDVPDALGEIVDRCLEKAPDDRYDSATDLVAELGSVLGATTTSAAPARPRSRAQKRKQLFAGVAASLVLAIAAVLALAFRTSDAAGSLDDSVLAVVPFTIRGAPEFDYLGEGMVDLMSAKLTGTGVGGFTTVNPRAVISLVNTREIDIADPAAGREIAHAMAAGRYVTGQITEVGGRITLTAYLYSTKKEETLLRQATVEGTADDLFDVIDQAVAELLAGSAADGSDRLQSLAAATSASLPATKAYLEGERFLRGGQYREASAAYDHAIELDSAFALAYYRKSIAADWIDAYDVRSSADKAMEFADRLSPRDRSLLGALRLRRHGLNDEAEQAYRSHLHQYPDEVEALVQLGEVLFHDNPRRGRSIAESMGPFQRAIDLEPSNLIAHIHLARMLALLDSTDRLAATAEYLGEVAPESERALEVEAMYAYAAEDESRQASVMVELAPKPWFYRWYATHAVARWVRDIDGAATILAARTSDEPLLYSLVPNHLVVRGRHTEFRQFMNGLDDQRNASWDLYEAFVLTSGAYDASEDELTAVLGRLKTATAGALLSSSWLPPYEDLTGRALEFERDYFVALLLLRLDRQTEVEAQMASMSAADSFPGIGSFKHDALHVLQAELAYRNDEPRRALELLRELRFEVPHAATVRAMVEGARGLFLRAELERQVGDRDVARVYYRGLDESWSPWDTYYRPVVYERLGRMAEEEGRTEEALRYYSRLIDIWRDADPEIVVMRREIEERVEGLLPD
jgi:tetratricopeptide (TPR) repeat protein